MDEGVDGFVIRDDHFRDGSVGQRLGPSIDAFAEQVRSVVVVIVVTGGPTQVIIMTGKQDPVGISWSSFLVIPLDLAHQSLVGRGKRSQCAFPESEHRLVPSTLFGQGIHIDEHLPLFKKLSVAARQLSLDDRIPSMRVLFLLPVIPSDPFLQRLDLFIETVVEIPEDDTMRGLEHPGRRGKSRCTREDEGGEHGLVICVPGVDRIVVRGQVSRDEAAR